MTDTAAPSPDAPEVLQRLVAVHERMIALAEKIAAAKAEGDPKLALQAMDRIEALGKGVRFCLMLGEKLSKVSKPASEETRRRKSYLRAALSSEHMRRRECEPREVERMLTLFEADGTLNLGDLLDTLRRACRFLGVPMPDGIEDDACRLADALTAEPEVAPAPPRYPRPPDAHGRAVAAIHAAARADSS